MKKIILFLVVCGSLHVSAQYTTKEIQRYKISKLTQKSYYPDVNTSLLFEYYYDAMGNDTAEYVDGHVYKSYKYEFKNNRIASRTTYDANGNESESSTYDYKPDGTYVISNTDKAYSMTDYAYFDKLGNETKSVSPDGGQIIYTYDTKGRLTSIKSKPGTNGTKTDILYIFDTKGRRLKEVSKGEFEWTATYSYDSKGMISKVISIPPVGDTPIEKKTVIYAYEYR